MQTQPWHLGPAGCSLDDRRIGTQFHRHAPEFLQRALQARDNLCGDFVRWGQAVGIGSAGVLEPEDVQVELVALSQIRVGELAEAFEFGAFVTAMLLPIGADEIVEVAALERRDRDLQP